MVLPRVHGLYVYDNISCCFCSREPLLVVSLFRYSWSEKLRNGVMIMTFGPQHLIIVCLPSNMYGWHKPAYIIAVFVVLWTCELCPRDPRYSPPDATPSSPSDSEEDEERGQNYGRAVAVRGSVRAHLPSPRCERLQGPQSPPQEPLR